MKRITVIILQLVLVALCVNAQQTTTDHFTAEDVSVDVNGKETVYLNVALAGSTVYSAFSVDVTLPEGVTFAKYEGDWDVYIDGGCIYPSNRSGVPTSHSLGREMYLSDNKVALALISAESAEMKATSGVLCYIGIIPTETAVPGDYTIKFDEGHLIKADASDWVTANTTAKLTIKNSTGIETIKENTSNVLYSVDGVKTAVPQKGRLYISNGKKVIL